MSVDKHIQDINVALMTAYCVVATVRGTRKMITGKLSIDQAQELAWSLKGDKVNKRAAFVPYPYKPKKQQ